MNNSKRIEEIKQYCEIHNYKFFEGKYKFFVSWLNFQNYMFVHDNFLEFSAKYNLNFITVNFENGFFRYALLEGLKNINEL